MINYNLQSKTEDYSIAKLLIHLINEVRARTISRDNIKNVTYNWSIKLDYIDVFNRKFLIQHLRSFAKLVSFIIEK